ncbi:MAG: zinc ribbon domain-containing protein [Cyanobacteria bacterium J06621_11]
MPICPQCKSTVSSDAITCPTCRTVLKAYGHPGMNLYRAEQDEVLCATCVYDADNSCNFPKRPNAKTCTLYQKVGAAAELAQQPSYIVPWWRKVNRFWLGMAILLSLSILMAVL